MRDYIYTKGKNEGMKVGIKEGKKEFVASIFDLLYDFWR